MTFVYSASLKGGGAFPAWISFDDATVTYTFNPNDNALEGTYDLSMHATIVPDATYQQLAAKSTEDFQIEVLLNVPPTFDPISYSKTESIWAHHNWNITVKYFNDEESNEPYMDAEFGTWVAATQTWTPGVKPSWFTVTNSTSKELYLEFKDPPQPTAPADTTLYHIRMKIWDDFNIGSETTDVIAITVKRNYPPYLTAGAITNLVIPSI